ncbi:hypothetical protein NYZ99_12630 [Maribacter litopenaei]|uniref:Thrombospondin type 3 repeat-containing protein n=1 Tax=Maribacter litopenaei TaxID=2976127 RepID=A0ABY5Y7J1_9FLAO|nr:hypothetical protein [Maribacter litopenaei]UWX53941.1 hypothetical protein NYZ99_12630 [Maribacter litopenaei]
MTCSIDQDVLTTNHETEDGVATVNPKGGTGEYTYLWDNGEKTQTATKLTYGMHWVTVTDSNGCETSCQVDIAKELYCWTNLIQNVSVKGGSDGAARAMGNGGYAPYTFKWDDGSTEQTNNTLKAGVHYVTITDAVGATSRCSVTIEEPNETNCSQLICSIEQDVLTMHHETEDGVATVYVKGGTGQYTYLWDNGETTQQATTLTYGMHSVTVTDINGCETTCRIDIAKELYCWINLYGNVTVRGGSDGSAKVHGNGGYRPFTYRWDDGTTDRLNTNLKAGTHYVTITDATGATSRCSITITEPGQEICDGVDNDGDGDIDEGFDQDGDGIADCYDDCDDTIDTDQDGVPDCRDACPGFDDTLDSDGDGTPDGCDIEVCDGVDNDGDGEIDEGFDKDGDGTADCYDDCDDTIDTDQDGVPDCKDICPGFDDTMDSDGDGTPDGCDIEVCDGVDNDGDGDIDEGFDKDGDGIADCFDECDDSIDTDQDGVPDCKDICPGFDDTMDSDGDGIPDGCDIEVCDGVDNDGDGDIDEGFDKDGDGIADCFDECDDSIDTDQDGVPDCKDICPGFDDTMDSDGDGIPDGCDDCDDRDDDQDGVPNCVDVCEGFDDNLDSDGDGTPDGCDDCDDLDDDGDGVRNCEDVCPDGDDMADSDGDGIPDACDEEVCDGVDNDGDGDIDEGLNCDPGSIDQCETAFARSSDENVWTCFLDIPNINANRWGWINEFPSIDGVYEMDLYAAAGQCDISKGALVGSVQVVYSGGSVSVTVSTLGGYKMTEAQLYVGSNAVPAKPNNGNLTVAPGDYPYEDNISGDFVTHTFPDVSAGDMDSFYVILHAEVCPMDDVAKYQAPTLELSGYPVPFKEDFTLVVISPREMKSELSLYDGIGKRVRDFWKLLPEKR